MSPHAQPLNPSCVSIPLDGSARSDAALRVGFALAERSRLPVTLLHAREGHDGQRHLDHAMERFSDVATCEQVVLAGRAADVILEHARANGALVCMASTGRSGLARLALGSVAEEVIRRNTAGTVVVGPRGGCFALPRERAIALFCTDGSARAAAAAPHTARLAELLDLRTMVVQRVRPDEDVALDGGVPPRPLLDAAQANCEQLQRYFESRHVAAEARVLFGETTRSIIHTAASTAATLISLATQARTGLDRFSGESTAAALIQRAPCPVFVVGPGTLGEHDSSS